jgi:pimeloyl-ACP methyl ester carboxylesterase
VLHAVQQPLSADVFSDMVLNAPAWNALPSWYMITQDDEALPPDAQRAFANRMGATTVEVPSGHLAMVSHPAEVVKLTETAADVVVAVKAVN